MKKNLAFWLTLLLAVSVALPGCTSPAATPAPTAVPTEAPTAAAPTNTPEPALPTDTPAAVEAQSMILATTTSTQDSGLLDFILPDFEKEFNVKVEVIAVGTGQALTLGQDGNADVLLVHSRAKEDEFMAANHGVRREDVMYNDFIIVGPESDPAGLKGMTSAVDAFKKIAEAKAVFISRGDESGTHTKELGIWKKAEIEPAGDWYVSAGQGMGEVLTMASEQLGYTLSDRATYLARSKEGLDLVILVEGDTALFNPYGVIAVNPDKGEHIKADLANQFIDWITSVKVQEKIGTFGVAEFAEPLFIPDSKLWNEAQAAAAPAAGLKVTGLVNSEVAWSADDLKGMENLPADYTNKDGETTTYTGVLISKLLELAGLKAEAAGIVFVAGDGYTAEVTLAELTACSTCIVAVNDDGSFRSVLPGFSSKAQVKGLVEIQVK